MTDLAPVLLAVFADWTTPDRRRHAHRESRLELLLFPVVLLAVIFLLAVAPVR